MKIGIFTFHCVMNYGAVLQAYGLQEYLKALGHDVFIIDYRPKYLLNPYNIFNRVPLAGSPISRLKILIKYVFLIPIRLYRNYLFKYFVHKQLCVYKLDLNLIQSDFDAFVFGSDQIWNADITDGGDKIYYGCFNASENKALIAYSASSGSINCIRGNNKQLLEFALSRFQSISVREKELSNYIKGLFDVTVDVTCDPVILSGVSVFNRIAKKARRKRPYLLLFQVSRRGDVEQFAHKIASRLNLELINLVSGYMFVNGIFRKNISPELFLGYLKEAAYIVTTSFHGTAFSILFHKSFTTVSQNETIDERSLSLLRDVGLINRMSAVNLQPDLSEINYDMVDDKIVKLRNVSNDYLLSALCKVNIK